MSKIYIFGHQNPDTDSICSALAYANLKRLIGVDDYIPIRLGPVSKETKFALNYFGLEPPALLEDLKPQVSDLNMPYSVVAYETDTVKTVLEKIINKIGRSIPVVDKNERLIGIVSISDIVPPFLEMHSSSLLKDAKTPYANILHELRGRIISGYCEEAIISGNVYVSSDMADGHTLEEEDILIGDYRENIIGNYVTNGCSIILTSVREDEVLQIDYPGTVIATPLSLYEVVRLISYSVPIISMVEKGSLEYFVTYETIDDVKENMLTSRHRRFPVVDELGYIQGMISRSNLVNINRKKAILVDHNEKSQSIAGIDEAEIVEVIDHHRVANVQTIAPLYFRTEPLGCTCTIVAKMYEENNTEISKQMAGIMLSAIISDTLLFKSPTCTAEDRRIGKLLAEIADVRIDKYGMKLITAGSSLGEETPDNIITGDMKKFMFGKHKIMISQINTGDFAGFYKLFKNILKRMEEMCNEEHIDLAVLMITDIVVGGTELLAVGKGRWMAENAFKMGRDDMSIFLPGVFSRKKQVVPTLMNAAQL